MKKRIVVIILLLMLILIPFPQRLKDGGTVRYKAVSYCITKEHSLTTEEEKNETGKMYHEGTKIEIFGIEIFNDVE